MSDRRRNLYRPRLLARMQRQLLRRALTRASVELDRGARRGAGWLHVMGFSGAEADALARELRGLAAATSVTRFRPAEIIR
jgi:hypothetical protein